MPGSADRIVSAMEPHVGVANLDIGSPDGTFTIGREDFPQFARYARLGVHVQSDQVRVAHPDPVYVETALAELAEACRELGVPEADVAFVETVVRLRRSACATASRVRSRPIVRR